jgi:hypothetical protein
MIVFEVKIHYAGETIVRPDKVYTITAADDVKARGKALYLDNKSLKGESEKTRPVIRFCEIKALVELNE